MGDRTQIIQGTEEYRGLSQHKRPTAMATQFDKLDKTTQWAGLTEANAARALAALGSTDAGLGARSSR